MALIYASFLSKIQSWSQYLVLQEDFRWAWERACAAKQVPLRGPRFWISRAPQGDLLRGASSLLQGATLDIASKPAPTRCGRLRINGARLNSAACTLLAAE